MKGLYCKKREGQSDGPQDVNNESALAGTENGGATGRSDFAEERCVVETKQDSFECKCRGKLHLTSCD